MAYSNIQLSVFALLSKQSQLQAKIMDISETRTMISDMQYSMMNNSSSQSGATLDQAKLQELQAAGDFAGMTDLITKYYESQASSDYTQNPNFAMLQMKDNQLDMDQEKFQTDLDATMTNLEAQQKLLDNNIKEDHKIDLIP
jgi:hypothetical protein